MRKMKNYMVEGKTNDMMEGDEGPRAQGDETCDVGIFHGTNVRQPPSGR